jgi:hypothetical protein
MTWGRKALKLEYLKVDIDTADGLYRTIYSTKNRKIADNPSHDLCSEP